MMKILQWTVAFGLLLISTIGSAQEQIIVLKPGNVNETIPELPVATQQRHIEKLAASGNIEAYFDQRYRAVITKLAKNYETSTFSLKAEINQAAMLYQIDPVHILGAIVGEHTFNVDIKDSLQEYAIKLGLWTGFFKGQHPFLSVSQCPEMRLCESQPNSYDLWSCYNQTWEKTFRGKTVCGGKNFPTTSLLTTFFNPTLAGKSYGLGQLSPMLILSLTDLVADHSHLPKVSISNVNGIYEAALNPRITVHYIAAMAYMAIDSYLRYAQFDISRNPGVVATLYNLGGDRLRAKSLKAYNQKQLQEGLPLRVPQENYYGWFVNKYENELRHYLK